MTAEVEPTGTNGVIVAQGASRQGFALFLHDGKLAFAVRVSGELGLVEAKEPLGQGHQKLEAQLAADGHLTLSVNGQKVAEGRASGLIPTQPGDGLTIGNDGKAAVGDYDAPNAFAGKIENVKVHVL